MTIPLLCAFLAIGLALGYGWSGAYVRAMRAETRAAKAEADLERALAGSEAIMGRLVATARISERRRIERDAARLDAEWAEVMRSVSEAQADIHAARHHCLVTLDGIRDGELVPASDDDPPLWTATALAEVLPIRGRKL